ncbi:MAG TPA: DUF29 domain-containing protein [Stellaceae bacterium]|nr:DUF29 domain-containing protein [Stellaceae bacterium]
MTRNAVAYEEDFFAWTQDQARRLREGELSTVDAENVAEELDDMGRSARRELRNRLSVLVAHLLKWRYQPGFRSPSWSGTIREQRRRVAALLQESPSLRPQVTRDLPAIYESGRTDAVAETGLPDSTIPLECPFTIEEILAEDFLPEDQAA